MSDKKTNEVLRTPECIECFENINTHANYVFGMFEVNSAELMKKQESKFSEHLEIQDQKYDKFLSRAEKRDYWRSGATLLILTLFASVISYNFVQQGQIEQKINQISVEKADKKEVPTLNEIKMLRDLGDQYNRSIYVRKENVNSDTSAYYWSKVNIYGSELRGSKKYYKEEYEKVKNETN